jgi:hypothetical protein
MKMDYVFQMMLLSLWPSDLRRSTWYLLDLFIDDDIEGFLINFLRAWSGWNLSV